MWKTVKLRDVVSYEKVNGHGSNRPYVGMEHISRETMKLVGSLEIQKKTSNSFKFDERHVLFGRLRPYLRKVFVPDFGGQCSTEIFCLLPSDKVDRRFLAHWLLHPKVSTRINETSTGARMPRANMNAILDFDFPLPPLAEQERIVAKLDAAFAEIDRAVETTSEHLKSIKQLFLTSLDTLVNADDLGESKPLGEICELAQGLAINKGTKHLLVRNSSKPLIRIKDLVNETEEQFITDEYENTKTEVNEEDLIFTRTGSLGLVFRGRKGVLHNNSFKVTPSQGLSRDYLYWWLKNPSFLNIIHSISGKAAQPDISHKLFKAQQIKIPTAVKQKDIVAKIELLFEQTEKMKRINLYKLHQIHTFKSAMLSQELQSSEAA